MISGAACAQSIYDFWLGMLPQVFAQMGAAVPPTAQSNGTGSALPFPADQVAKAASMTSDALQSIARSYAPMLQAAGAPGLLSQWASMMPGLIPAQPTAAPTTPSAAAMAIPWMAMPFTPAMLAAATGQAMPVSPAGGFLPLQQIFEMAAQICSLIPMLFSQPNHLSGIVGIVAGGGALHHLQQVSAELAGDVVDRCERPRREQAVARTPGPGGLGHPILELLDKGRLADSGLAGDQHEATAAVAGLVGVLEQRPEL